MNIVLIRLSAITSIVFGVLSYGVYLLVSWALLTWFNENAYAVACFIVALCITSEVIKTVIRFFRRDQW